MRLTSFVLTDFGGAESREIMGASDKGRRRKIRPRTIALASVINMYGDRILA